jgi:hypothetical protein
MIPFLVKLDDVLFHLQHKRISNRHRFPSIEFILNGLVTVLHITDLMTLCIEHYHSEYKGSDLQGSEGDIFLELFIKNFVLFLKIDDLLPIPFVSHKFAIWHVSSQRSLSDVVEGDSSSIVGRQKR